VPLLLSMSFFTPAKFAGSSAAKRASSAAGSAEAAGQMKKVGRSQKGGLGVKGPAPAEPAENNVNVTCYITCYMLHIVMTFRDQQDAPDEGGALPEGRLGRECASASRACRK
jgi:hypothetical protein